MNKNLIFHRKLPIPMEVKGMYPMSEAATLSRERQLAELEDIFTGKSKRLLLVIGPCSADSEEPVLEYISRLRRVQDKVADKIMIVPRIYTGKPRTTGEGYKGMLHQPISNGKPDMLEGLIAIRRLFIKALEDFGFIAADEMLYPENHRYLSDVIGYVAVGARSTEDQHHRLTASGIDVPVGFKNPTSGDISVMMNSIKAAQGAHTFLYRGWEVESRGNPLAHSILRGYVDKFGKPHANYHYEDLEMLCAAYDAAGLKNPAVIVDTNHSNSGKKYFEQPRIAKDVLHSCHCSSDIASLVKGFMIESYIEDGAQTISDHEVFGKSITDPCLGWEGTERLIYDLAELA